MTDNVLYLCLSLNCLIIITLVTSIKQSNFLAKLRSRVDRLEAAAMAIAHRVDDNRAECAKSLGLAFDEASNAARALINISDIPAADRLAKYETKSGRS